MRFRFSQHAFRLLPILLLIAGGSCVYAQLTPAPTDRRPDAALTIKRYPVGAEIVEVTMEDPNYPTDLLEAQIVELGRRVGDAPRGLQVYTTSLKPGDPKFNFVKARFGMAGLIEPGRLPLAPIAQSFCGSNGGFTIRELDIVYDGERPTGRTLQKYHDDFADVVGTFNTAPLGIEYKVQLFTADPAKVSIPDHVVDTPEPTAQQPKEKNGRVSFWVPTALAAVAVGLLVYFLQVGRLNSRKR